MIERQGREVVDKKKYNNGSWEAFQSGSSRVAAVAAAAAAATAAVAIPAVAAAASPLQRFSVSRGFQT